jgi:carbonic anhydrase
MPHFPDSLTDRYRRFKFRHFTPNAERYEELARFGQSPDTMIVSCSDSRCDPETIFSAMPGELFVVRNVANLIPPYEHTTGRRFHGVSSALEYAILNLRIKHLVVMGHSGCGGIKAALNSNAVEETEARFISRWMSMLDEPKLRVLARRQADPDADLAGELERECVKLSLANLRTFPFVIEHEEKGSLSLYGAHFDILTGQLSVLNQATGQFNGL